MLRLTPCESICGRTLSVAGRRVVSAVRVSEDGSGGFKRQVNICRDCRQWPIEKIVAAIQSWAAEHDGIPPTTTEWRHATRDHPASSTVKKRAGGWNRALLLAGFSVRYHSGAEYQAWIEGQIRAGRSVQSIADELGVGIGAIYMRFRYRGIRVRDLKVA